MSLRIARVVGVCVMLSATIHLEAARSASTAADQESPVHPPVVIKSVSPRGGTKTDRVTFDCTVRDDGTVSIIGILKSTGAKLNDIATEAMKQWLFKPATRDGKPVPFRVAVELTFKP
jgi:periplasmic protein TonB